MQLPFDVIFLVLDLVLFLDQRACFLLELVRHVLCLSLFLPHALYVLFELLVFLSQEVELCAELLTHDLVLLNHSLMIDCNDGLLLRGLACLLGRALELV